VHSEQDIRQMLDSMRQLVVKYEQIRIAAGRRRDPEAERIATTKEANYRTIVLALDWVVGEQELPQEDIPSVFHQS